MLKMLKKGFGEMLQGLNMFHELGDSRGEMMVARLGLGQFFFTAGLFQDAAGYFRLAFQIGEKIGAYDDMAMAYDWLGTSQVFTHPEKADVALSHTLKALEYVQKTDAEKRKWELYSSLVIRYAMVGDSARAEEFFAKLMIAPKQQKHLEDSLYLVFPKIVMLCVRGRWEEAEEEFEKNEASSFSLGWQMILTRSFHAWALDKQSKVGEAEAQLCEIQRLTREAERSFAHVNLQASLMVKKELAAREEFELRLDLVNVARSSGSVVRIEGMVHAEFQVQALPCLLHFAGQLPYNQGQNHWFISGSDN